MSRQSLVRTLMQVATSESVGTVAPKRRIRKPKSENDGIATGKSTKSKKVKFDDDDLQVTTVLKENERASDTLSTITDGILHLNIITEPDAPTSTEDKSSKIHRSNIIKEAHTEIANGYFTLLREFHTETWPLHTDVCCWWCCHPCNTRPIGLPVKQVKDVFIVKGCFCSFSCALAYAHGRSNSELLKEKPLLLYMHKILTGGNMTANPLQRAPQRELLQMFGGPMTIEEFRASSGTSRDILCAPLYPLGMFTENVSKVRSYIPKASEARARKQAESLEYNTAAGPSKPRKSDGRGKGPSKTASIHHLFSISS